MLNYSSTYKPHANQSYDWWFSDGKPSYENNVDKNYETMKTNGWINSSFKYTFNSHGFRCEEFTDEPTIMFLGCSLTMGIGLPIESIWPELVSKNLNMRCANLGIGGSASDTAFRLCHGWIDIVKPKIVIFLEPPGFRLELVNSKVTKIINTYSNEPFKPFVKEWTVDDNNSYFNSQKNQLGMKSLCNDRQIKFLSFNAFDLVNNKIDLARDLIHPGPKTHKLFVEHVLKQLGSQ